jgi:hypothetical protein
LAFEFRVAINDQSDMTTGCKFQFLQNIASSHFSFCAFVVQLLFVGAQRGEMLILVFLKLTLWFWSDFGGRCVGTFYASVGEKIKKEMSVLSAPHMRT